MPPETPPTDNARTPAAIGRKLAIQELGRHGITLEQSSDHTSRWVVRGCGQQAVEVRVKVAGAGAWQYNVDRFLQIHFHEATGIQTITGLQTLDEPRLLHLFVHLGTHQPPRPRFFLLTQAELQGVIHQDYAAFLARLGGRRPRAPKSRHCAVWPDMLAAWENHWAAITG